MLRNGAGQPRLMHTPPFHGLLLSALLLPGAAAAAEPLLPADQLPAGMRLQATVIAAQAARSFALFSGSAGNSRKHPGDDLGNGLRLDTVAADRIWVSRDGSRYQLRLQTLAADRRLRPAAASSNPPRPVPGVTAAAANGMGTASAGLLLSANNLDQVRAQCNSATMAQLSAEHRLEIQAMGLCP